MHQIEYYVYEEKVNKKRVQEELNKIANHGGDCFCGLPSSIQWLTEINPLQDENAATEYLENHDTGDYDQKAVRFFSYKNVEIKPTQEIIKLREKVSKSNKKLYDLEDYHFQYRQAVHTLCKNCTSRIAVKYLKKPFCPVCGASLRTPQMISDIDKEKENLKKLKTLLKEKETRHLKKYSKTAKVMWLVKIEYHC